MKKLLVLVGVALALAMAQETFAKAVRVRESAVGQGLEVGGAGGVKKGKLPVGGKSGGTISAIDAAAALGDALGVDVSPDALDVRSDDADAFGRRHVRLRQIYRGVEVDARELVVHFGTDGRVYEVNGDWLDGLALDVTPAVEVEGATLVVFCKGDDAAVARLAWKKRKGRNFIFTDAKTGEKLHVRAAGPRHAMDDDDDEEKKEERYDPFDGDKIIEKATTLAFPEGTATAVQGNMPIQQGGALVEIGATLAADGKTYLTTTTENGVEIGIIDGHASPKYRSAAAAAYAAKDNAWFDWFLKDASWTEYSEDSAEDMPNALAIINNIDIVLDYYKEAFNRNSYDDRGGRIAAWRFWQEDGKDIDKGLENAFWASLHDDEPKMKGCFFFGYDLSGERSETSFDTCAHELTHGITTWTANLIYEGEPGALNESFSDIIAASAEFATQPRAKDVENPGPGEADWLFDEDSGTPARSFANPLLYEQPSRYKGSNWINTDDTSDDNDAGGVHYNSGVQNHFFYLLSEGGTGRNDGFEYDLVGIGVEKAAQVAYLALTAYCVQRTDYSSVVDCWDSAAQDLIESGVLTEADRSAIKSAWQAVLSAPNDNSCGDVVYANEDGLFLQLGAPNARGISRISLAITTDEGKTVKLTGKAQNGAAELTKRNVGTAKISLWHDAANVVMEGAEETLPRVSPLIDTVEGLEDLRVGVAFESELDLDDGDDMQSIRWSGKKMPSGVKVVNKTGKVSGIPKKAGSGEATVEAKCKFSVIGQKKPVSAKVARKVKWQVAPLDDGAQGKFTGDGVTVTINKSGRIKGEVLVNGQKVRFSAKSYTSFADGKYVAASEYKGGSFIVSVAGGQLSGTLTSESGVTTAFSARK